MDKQPDQTKGPMGYENWRAFESGRELVWAYEVPVYTDARFVPVADQSWGPYKLFNTLAGESPISTVRPAFVLRVVRHDSPVDGLVLPSNKSDVSRFHGGAPAEEVTALLSLTLGVRLRNGGMTRVFTRGKDPAGRPIGANVEGAIVRPTGGGKPVIPRTLNLDTDGFSRMSTYKAVSPEIAVALSRAARLYQDATWIADGQPELSWVMLVSAVEVAAAAELRSADETPEVTLKELRPLLFKIIDKHGDDQLLRDVAKDLQGLFGSARKFRDFAINHLPRPLKPRPPQPFQVDWSPEAMRKHMQTIYDHRSKALHEGIPFPPPMCAHPNRAPESEAWVERPTGRAVTKGGAWSEDDAPMLLHTFEHIVRRALLHWWDVIAVPAA